MKISNYFIFMMWVILVPLLLTKTWYEVILFSSSQLIFLGLGIALNEVGE